MTVKISSQEKKELAKLIGDFKRTKSGSESVKIAKAFEQKVDEIKAKA